MDKASAKQHDHLWEKKKRRHVFTHMCFAKKLAAAALGASTGSQRAWPGRTCAPHAPGPACPAAGSSAWSAVCKLPTVKPTPSGIRPKRYTWWEGGEAGSSPGRGARRENQASYTDGCFPSQRMRGGVTWEQVREQSPSGDGVPGASHRAPH